MPRADRVAGIVLAAVGALAYAAASKLPPVPGQQVGPSAFPMVIGAGLVLCGLLIALGVGRGFEDDGTAAAADAESAEPAPAGAGWRVIVPPLALVFYVVAVNRIGFVPTAAAIAFVIGRLLGASWRIAIGVAVVAPVLIHLAFYKLLRVPLPAGWLPMPW